jgi:hypothetical protein
MIGYHIYYQKNNEISFVEISSQFASALFWKKHFGPIRLYCNSKFLESISLYKLDLLYDEINVDILDNITYDSKILSKYWSIPKLYAAKEISKSETTYCILDTDLWITNYFEWDKSKDFLAFHYETFDLKNKNNPYLIPSSFISLNDYEEKEWDFMAMNCAFMYINNQQMIFDWVEYADAVIKLNKTVKTKNKKDVYTLFIEQRAITYICEKLKLDYGTFIPNIFISGLESDKELWNPKLNFLDEPQKYIKHIWGLKKFYDSLTLHLLEVIYNDIHSEFGFLEIDFPELYIKRLTIIQNETSIN